MKTLVSNLIQGCDSSSTRMSAAGGRLSNELKQVSYGGERLSLSVIKLHIHYVRTAFYGGYPKPGFTTSLTPL